MTLEDARTELQRAKEVVRRQAEESGMGFLTNAGYELGFSALYVWGNKGEEVWITSLPEGYAPRLSDEEAVDVLMEQGVEFPHPAGKVRWVSVEEGDDPDDIIARLESPA